MVKMKRLYLLELTISECVDTDAPHSSRVSWIIVLFCYCDITFSADQMFCCCAFCEH